MPINVISGAAGTSGGNPSSGLWGSSSWFGGPSDPTAGSTTASGAPISEPGIAVYNRATLGGYWAIKAPNGSIGIVKQTDIGPAPSTGRTFDYTYSLLPEFGYSQSNFPTGGQTFGFYLGKLTDPTFGTALSDALGKLGATPSQTAGLIQSVDVGAIEKGKSAVVVPANQPPGTTYPQYGQSPSGSSAVPAGIDPSGIGSAITGGLTSIVNGLIGDASYAGLFLVLIAIAGFLIIHGLTGKSPTPQVVLRGAAAE